MAATQKHVLVVDDALDIARLLRSALGAADPDLVINVFPSAEEAIFASAREPVHLLISDIRLPGISGAELVRRIRINNPDVKVILITGLNQEQSDAHVNGLSVDGFFQKPFEVSEFVALAQRCLLEAMVAPPEKKMRTAESAAVVPAGVGERLRELQKSVNAETAMLFDLDGVFLMGTGKVPTADLAVKWGTAANAALADQAAVVSLLKSKPKQRILTLHGGSQDLILASVGRHILVLLMPGNSSPLRLALAYEEILRLLPAIDLVLRDQQIVVFTAEPDMISSTEPTPIIESETEQSVPSVLVDVVSQFDRFDDIELLAEQDVELASLLLEETAPADGEDIDAYWDSITDVCTTTHAMETISYEEALRLGLANDENGYSQERL
jgi:DNA-binding response OmpR family regulator